METSNTDDPLVSVVMPSHNNADTIKDTIESVINGTYSNYEIIVVDDHSTDETRSIVESISARNPKVKLLILKNGAGASSARNLAINQAKGDYIAFLDSDDLWKKNKLSKQIKFMQKEGVSFCYSDYEYVNAEGKPFGRIRKCPPKVSYLRMLLGCSVGCLTIVYDAKKTGKIKIPNLKKRNDYALWCLILKKVHVGKKCPGILASYRRTKSSLSSGSKVSLIKYHYQMHRQSNEFIPPVALFFTITNIVNYVINIVFREKRTK